MFIDSNIFFYSIIGDRKYGKACARIIKDIAEKRIQAIISPLILLETANALKKFGVDRVYDRIRAIISLPIKVVDLNRLDIYMGIELAEKYGISPYDATHIVVAMRINVKEIISADKEFDKVPEIKRVDPLEYSQTL